MQIKEMFNGMKVLELASVLAGPAVGQFFAELGAEVIKVENPRNGGDVTRSWKIPGEPTDDRPAYFCSVNWGKKSVAVDLSDPKGQQRVHALVRQADVVLASYKPGDAEKLGVAYAQLKKINPTIIYGQITGYGSDSNRVGYDAVIQAEAGFMSMNGEPNGAPLKMPVALVDILAAHHLKEALLLAIVKKERTGEGSCVEVSLFDAAVSSLANQGTNWLMAGQVPGRTGSLHPNIAPYGELLTTKDHQQILLAVGSDKQFRALCALLGEESLSAHPDYATNEARVKNRSALAAVLNQHSQHFTVPELLEQLHARQIPAGSIQTLDQVFAMPAAQRMVMQHGSLAGVITFAAEEVNDQTVKHDRSKLLPPPKLGEHTEAIFK
jgi:crotonobetainyl-CoA:carnitine CoA-transferase CaiB-like acyl-CoA transferase